MQLFSECIAGGGGGGGGVLGALATQDPGMFKMTRGGTTAYRENTLNI